MNCLKPIPLRNPAWLNGDTNSARYILVGCGKCPLCLSKKRQDWAFRIKKHAKFSIHNFFITLTYDTMYLPLDSKGIAHVSKRDCQTFIKRLRKYLSRFENSEPLSYYLCSEYGPTTLRPHYHLLLFNVPEQVANEKDLFEIVMKTWKLGFCQVGHLKDGGCGYVAKYVLHPVEGFPDFLTKPFSLMSKGIGKAYVTDALVTYCYANGTYIINDNGFKRSIPRYLREKIFTKEELALISSDIVTKLKDKYLKTIDKIAEDNFRYSRPFDLYHQQLEHRAKQIVKNLKKKHKLSNL